MRNRNAPSVNAPDKGSFPLDHFRECEREAEEYRLCLAEAAGIPKKCKEQAQKYLECRMDKGLMAKQSVEQLGFIPESTMEFEEKSIIEMYQKVDTIMRESRERVWREYMQKKQRTQPNE